MMTIAQKLQELTTQGIDPGPAQTGEMPCRAGGIMQPFENVTIYSHPGLGTFALQTVIRDAYEQDGGVESSPLGYPTSDEQDDPDVLNGRLNTFQQGRITWDALRSTTIERADVPGGPKRPVSLSALDDVTGRVLEEINAVPGMARRPPKAGRAIRSGYIGELLEARIGSLPDGQTNAPDFQSLLLELEQNDVPVFPEWASRPLSQVQHLVTEVAGPANEETFSVVSAAVSVDDTLDVVLAWPGDVHPKLVAVSVPRSLLSASEWPVVVYFHPSLQQAQKQEEGRDFYTLAENLRSIEDGQFYPYGWDFLHFIFWNYLMGYSRAGLNTHYSVGMNYQRQIAGKEVVNVIPILHNTDGIGLGDVMNPDRLLRLLGEIKWHFTQKVTMTESGFVAPENFRLAIGAFSSANPWLAQLISHTDSVLCRDCLREVYFFDPPTQKGDACISRAMRWAADNGDKHVRFYTQTGFNTLNKVVGNKTQVKYKRLVADPKNPNRSVALLDKNFWQSVATGPLAEQVKGADYGEYHSLIASGTLVDALARSGF